MSQDLVMENLCQGICEDSMEVLNWNWDEHFQTVLSQFSKNEKDKVMDIVSNHFNSTYDHQSISSASDTAQMSVRDLGGLREGQMFFFQELEDGRNLFGAWWPWGNDQTISIRIGFSLGSANNELNSKLKNLFGIQ